jgi:hypothetical protein
MSKLGQKTSKIAKYLKIFFSKTRNAGTELI